MNLETRRVSATRLVDLLGPPQRPNQRWLSERIRTLVADGGLLHGTRLPSERELSARLGLSRTTVTGGYADLRERGFARARHGSGTVIVVPGGQDAGGGEPFVLGGSVASRGSGGDSLDLTNAAPNAVNGIAPAYAEAVENLGRYAVGGGYYPVGIPELREAVAHRFSTRGLATTPDQIVITTGALEAIAVVARAVLPPGGRVLIESPTYPNSVTTLRREGARPVSVPTGAQGTDPDVMDNAIATSQARMALLLPDFNNPTGVLTDDEGRERIARSWARRGVIGLIDETLAELSLTPGEAPRPMAAHAKDAITVGGVSKVFWGGLRVGWIRVPTSMVNAIALSRITLGLGTPVLEQLVVVRLLQEADTVIPERREELRLRRDALMAAVRSALPQWQAECPAGGLSSWWRLPSPRSPELVRRAADEGLLLAPGSTFAISGTGLDHWLRLPFARPVPELQEAAQRLGTAWQAIA